MKKILLIVMVVIVMVTSVACGNVAKEKSLGAVSTEPEAPKAEVS